MAGPDTCPCGTPEHPRVLHNPAGRSVIDYRVGAFISFRHALLRGLPGETQLSAWRPGGDGDLGVQAAEWWAYLADILAIYNERIAHQGYLRTADQADSLGALIRLLGYRPRPGIAAHGTLAALLDGGPSVTLPRGFQIQSKPGPGKQPQVFELDVDTTLDSIDAVAFDPQPADATFVLTGSSTVFLRGTSTTLKAGDQALLLHGSWDGSTSNYDVLAVKSVSHEKDPRGAPITRITFARPLNLPSNAALSDYRLMYGPRPAFLWQLGGITAIPGVPSTNTIDLENAVRQIHVGDPVLLSAGPDPAKNVLLSVSGYLELVWYANPDDPSKPDQVPAKGGIPILHTRLTFVSLDPSDWQKNVSSSVILHSWRDAGQLIAQPSLALSGSTPTVTSIGPSFPPLRGSSSTYPLLIEGAGGSAARATASPGGDSQTLDMQTVTDVQGALATPLRALFGLLPVTRGETVANEVLGNGDASQAGQEFVLKKSPLTYVLDPSSSSGENYKSTLRVWVNGIEWMEVASFYGQKPDATIFVTREDDLGKSHVQFGDGYNGARLATGVGNVVAGYRTGSGAEAPTAGTLTVVLQPQPGLKAIRNPIPVGGGADPDPPDQIRRYAPRSVLTFGRAVSWLDYETIAAQAPGVARARAYWSWDANEQRNLVKVYVGDDQAAVDAAKLALAGAEDPNRPISVFLAEAISDPDVIVSVEPLPGRKVDDVRASVTAALFDDQTGLFGIHNVRIGKPVYESQIVAACMNAAGVAAVHFVEFSTNAPDINGVLWDPGEGKFFLPDPINLWVDVEASQ